MARDFGIFMFFVISPGSTLRDLAPFLTRISSFHHRMVHFWLFQNLCFSKCLFSPGYYLTDWVFDDFCFIWGCHYTTGIVARVWVSNLYANPFVFWFSVPFSTHVFDKYPPNDRFWLFSFVFGRFWVHVFLGNPPRNQRFRGPFWCLLSFLR